MSNNKQKTLRSLKNKTFVKIISGIQNYDKQKVLNVARAAELGGATALDICDDAQIIKDIRSTVQLPLFVSSVEPEKLISAQKLGADVLEVGNYESFYKIGKLFSSKEILQIINTLSRDISADVLLCCTIPATLEIENQIKLGKELINLGVDILQTEGFSPDIPVSDRQDKSFTEILKATPSLANTMELRKALPNANIICASGITPISSLLAITAGASGIGVGTFINSCSSQLQMTERVEEIMTTLNIPLPTKINSLKLPAIKI